MKNTIRIGNAGGFWGDDLDAFNRQLTGGDLDYISMDFLAEITMSILTGQRMKNPDLGFVPDFVDQINENAQLIKSKKVKIISNAGGINPFACAQKIAESLLEQNIDLKIAVVEGDNIVTRITDLIRQGVSFENMETGKKFKEIQDKVISANVYLGVLPIVEALKHEADIIICGRVTDTSISLAPMIYEFGWKLNDWNKLASGTIAAHIIECGAQSSGGNFTDWLKVHNWSNFGYPIIEMNKDSSFFVTKHKNTGGLVSVETVKEQLVYEMGNPEQYISPDVIADFTSISIKEDSANKVFIQGIKGYPSTSYLKISMTYKDGLKAGSSIIISGPDAIKKADKFSEILQTRIDSDFEKFSSQLIGLNSCHRNLIEKNHANEVLLRFSVYDSDIKKIDKFSKAIAPLILSGPPGVAVTGGRPRAQAVLTYWPALINKKFITAKVQIINNMQEKLYEENLPTITGFEEELLNSEKKEETISVNPEDIVDSIDVKIGTICLARSGDKGNTANIGVIARSQEIYNFIKHTLTESYIKQMFSAFCFGKVSRYEMDNLLALNFLLEDSLDGGGTKSLMIDAQGKTFAQALLNQKIEIPKIILDRIKV